VIRDGTQSSIFSQDIKTGDIVVVNNGQHFPADLVVISTAQEDASCYVETANLDGYDLYRNIIFTFY
jgi:P-type E1-E2 ATPase